GARPLAARRLGGLLPRLRARPRPLHLVEPAARRARAQRGLAHRLRAGLAGGDALRARGLPPARRHRVRPLPGGRRPRPRGPRMSRAEPAPPAARPGPAPRLGPLRKSIYASGDFTVNTSLVALAMLYSSHF